MAKATSKAPIKKPTCLMLARIEEIKARLVKDRNDLRDVLDDALNVLQSADDAVAAMEDAVESLSHYV